MNINASEYAISNNLGDTIERLEFSQNQSYPHYLSAGGWDGKFYLWSIKLQNAPIKQSTLNLTSIKPSELQFASIQQIFSFNLEEPIFSLCWQRDQNTIFAGTVDGSFYTIDLQSSSLSKIQQFDTGLREILHFKDDSFDLIITGNYDGVIRLWDPRDFSAPKALYETKNIISAMCLDGHLLVVAMHNGLICYFNLQKLRFGVFEPEIVFESNFNNSMTIYSLSAFANMEGFCCTCLEGKVSVCFVNLNAPAKFASKESKKLFSDLRNLTFRTHRKNENESFMVHQVKVNKPYGTFASCGSDGTACIWDHLSKTRLKTFNFSDNAPITAINFSMDGNVFAYACGVDWKEGHNSKKYETRIALKCLSDSEKLMKPAEKKP